MVSSNYNIYHHRNYLSNIAKAAASGLYTKKQYHQLKRKVDKYLLPLMWLCYGIQQTDKTSLGTQAIFGLREDTKLVGQQYSWLTTVFCT